MSDSGSLPQGMKYLPPVSFIFQVIQRNFLKMMVVGGLISIVVFAALSRSKIVYRADASIIYDTRNSFVGNSRERFPDFGHLSARFFDAKTDPIFLDDLAERLLLEDRIEFSGKKSGLKESLSKVFPPALVPSTWNLEGEELVTYKRNAWLGKRLKPEVFPDQRILALTTNGESPEMAFEFNRAYMELFIEKELNLYRDKLNTLHSTYESTLEAEKLRLDALYNVLGSIDQEGGDPIDLGPEQKKALKEQEKKKIEEIRKKQEELETVFESLVRQRLSLEAELANLATQKGPTHPEILKKREEIDDVRRSPRPAIIQNQIDREMRKLMTLQARMKRAGLVVDESLMFGAENRESTFLESLTQMVNNLDVERNRITQEIENPGQRIRFKYSTPPRLDTRVANRGKLIISLLVGIILILFSCFAVTLISELRNDHIRDVWRVRNLAQSAKVVRLDKKDLKYCAALSKGDVERLKDSLQDVVGGSYSSELNSFQKLREFSLLVQPIKDNTLLLLPVGFHDNVRNIPSALTNISSNLTGESTMLLDLNPVNSAHEGNTKSFDLVDFLNGKCKWGEVKVTKGTFNSFDYAQIREGNLQSFKLSALKKLFKALREQYHNVVIHGLPDHFFLENYNFAQMSNQYVLMLSLGQSTYSDLKRNLSRLDNSKIKAILVVES